jgi:hypothetical protein
MAAFFPLVASGSRQSLLARWANAPRRRPRGPVSTAALTVPVLLLVVVLVALLVCVALVRVCLGGGRLDVM